MIFKEIHTSFQFSESRITRNGPFPPLVTTAKRNILVTVFLVHMSSFENRVPLKKNKGLERWFLISIDQGLDGAGVVIDVLL